jgi:cell division protein FtsB
MADPTTGFQPATSPAERRAFFDILRTNKALEARVEALEAANTALEARVADLETP